MVIFYLRYPDVIERKKSSMTAKLEITGIHLSHPEKIYFPKLKITKADLAQYYHHAIAWILPHLIKRPLAVLRCPEGLQGECFYQKHIETLPDTLGQVTVKEQNATRQHLVIKNEKSLMTLIQFGALELHTWSALADDIDTPDRMIFDLDPGPDVSFNKVIHAAQQLKAELEKLNLQSFVKTSGKKGLHVFIPLKRVHSWDEVKDFAYQLAQKITTRAPKDYVTTINKSERQGKILIDYLRNQRGATCVSAYSTRATPNAGISTPLTWAELTKLKTADTYHFNNITHRLKNLKHDPWADFFKIKQQLK